MHAIHCVLFIAVASGLCAAADTRPAELVGIGQLPGTAADASGLIDAAAGFPLNMLGGLSGLEYTGSGDRFWAICDRGPADGEIDFPCRVHEIELPLPSSGPGSFVPRIIATHLLTDEAGIALRGRASLFDSEMPRKSQRFDPEAVRKSSHGTLWISDEYGPDISEYSLDGKRIKRLNVPDRFCIQHPAATKEQENTSNVSGRRSNAGFEGLAVNSSGKRMFVCIQRPLIQDSQGPPDHLTGLHCRLLQIDLETGHTREFVVRLDAPNHGINELLAWGDDRLLLIERDDKPGVAAQFKRIMAVHLDGATDVSNIERLPSEQLPIAIRPMRKETVIDLLDPRYGLAGPSFPEKIEGLAFGRPLADGRQLLVVGTDNDCNPKTPSRFWMFALSDSQ